MMKKLLPLSAVAIGIMFSAQASATTGAIAASSTLTPDPAGANVCEALSGNITVQLSDGVNAAWNCGDTYFLAATCHTSGTNKQQTISCSYTQDVDSSGNPISGQYSKSAEVCPDYTGDGAAPTKATFFGRVGFRGTSYGGSVATTQLYNETVCSTTSIQTLVQ